MGFDYVPTILREPFFRSAAADVVADATADVADATNDSVALGSDIFQYVAEPEWFWVGFEVGLARTLCRRHCRWLKVELRVSYDVVSNIFVQRDK